jgi:sulfur relay (sulfurtransferase) complex TusBCD TusD component (DsrE family)
MKVAILLKSGPDSAEAERTLTIASDMLSQGHAVTLCLMHDAVHLCRSGASSPAAVHLQYLMEKHLSVKALKQDCSLRGIDQVSETLFTLAIILRSSNLSSPVIGSSVFSKIAY